MIVTFMLLVSTAVGGITQLRWKSLDLLYYTLASDCQLYSGEDGSH